MSQGTMRAIKVVGQGKVEIQDVPVPDVRADSVLVKINCVAVNPIDVMDVDYMPVAGCILGCDFSGTIAEVGSSVKKAWKTGDRVAGWVLGNNVVNKAEGAFAEYCVANGETSIKIGDGMSDEEAASPPAGIATAGMGLFLLLGMEIPGQGDGGKGEPVLVYGGTSATATLAIQFAKLAGYDVITTCSPRSFNHVKSLGASAAFDYKDPDCADKIREYTKDNLTKVLDTIAKDKSPQICADSISSTKGGVISHTLPYPEDLGRKDVEAKMLFTLGLWGEDFGYGEQVMPGVPEYYTFAKEVYPWAEKVLAEGKVRVHPPKVGKGGLQGVIDSLQDMREGKQSGSKLVYYI